MTVPLIQLWVFFSPLNSLHCKRPLDATGIGTDGGKHEKKHKKEDKQKKCVTKGNCIGFILQCVYICA